MTPISSVAAMIPKASAARSPGTFLSVIRPSIRVVAGAWLVAVGTYILAGCASPTQPPRSYAVLDDQGQSDWQTVSVGASHSCALKTGGNAYCWGDNRFGQLGVTQGDSVCSSGNVRFRCSAHPLQVQPGVRFASISAGGEHTCAITVSKEAYCWGDNDSFQVSDLVSGGPTLTKIPGSLPWTQISAGSTHTCAVRSDGALFCWGANDRGQLGVGRLGGNVIGVVQVPMPAPVAAVSAGEARTCARTTTGIVYCWGAVWVDRQNGLEYTRAQTSPQLVPGAPALAWLSVGSFTTCGADRSGFAYCWEANPRGEMGNGTQDGSTTPQRVASDLEFLQVSAGIVQSCGIVTSGAGLCWGDDSFGQLGVLPSQLVERCGAQRLPCATKPTPVFGRQQFTEISTGFGSHTCGVTTHGNLYCWGLGASGQRGDGFVGGGASTPAKVLEPVNAIAHVPTGEQQ